MTDRYVLLTRPEGAGPPAWPHVTRPWADTTDDTKRYPIVGEFLDFKWATIAPCRRADAEAELRALADLEPPENEDEEEDDVEAYGWPLQWPHPDEYLVGLVKRLEAKSPAETSLLTEALEALTRLALDDMAEEDADLSEIWAVGWSVGVHADSAVTWAEAELLAASWLEMQAHEPWDWKFQMIRIP